MEPIRDPKVLARVRLMFDLYEAAEAMMRQNLLRWFPEESEELIERRLRAWLRKDPGYSRTPFEVLAGRPKDLQDCSSYGGAWDRRISKRREKPWI